MVYGGDGVENYERWLDVEEVVVGVYYEIDGVVY